MKIRTLLLAAALFITVNSPAQAGFVGYLGHLTIGDSGVLNNLVTDFDIDGDGAQDLLYGYATGSIPSDSKITFTYNFLPSPPTTGTVHSYGAFTMDSSTQRFSYVSTSDGSNKLYLTSGGAIPNPPITVVDMDPADMPVLAAADQSSWQTSVTNTAFAAAGFTSFLLGPISGSPLTSVSYVVSAVPLPAALPLFGIALAGVAGYSRRKKIKATQMKICSLFLVIGLLMATSTPAKALSVTGYLGDLSIGDSGSVSNFVTDYDVTGNLTRDPLYGYATGTIPSNSMITFTYTLAPGTTTTGNLFSTGAFRTDTPVQSSIYTATSAGSNTLTTLRHGALPWDAPISTINLDPADMPVSATADLASGITQIANIASAAAAFSTYLLGPLASGSVTNVTYVVSAVPLPAALPLFGLALAGAAGYSRRRKKSA